MTVPVAELRERLDRAKAARKALEYLPPQQTLKLKGELDQQIQSLERDISEAVWQ